jgi:putative membrane-bound dehydrogenase-like protein
MLRLTLVCNLLFSTLLLGEVGPVRVLYIDDAGTELSRVGPLHGFMRDLGREGIYFDYTTVAADPASGALYDATIKAGDAEGSDAVRALVLEKLSPERRKSWEAFLAGREVEKREKRDTVANYEKRPEPLTFQLPMSPKGSLERIQVPADCQVSLFASEPEIAKPIAMAWDGKGRLWIAETADYPHGVMENGQGHDSIRICEDTDHDGRADKFTVFATGLNIPTGLVLVNGGVIVSQPPRFVFLKDTNGDDKADERKEIISGWGIRDTHAQASNLHYGFDNWIYGCVGYSGFERSVDGATQTFAMGTYRFRPDGSGLEFLHQFTNNSWGQGCNDAGDQFGGTANGAPLFFCGIPATAYGGSPRGMTAKKINVVEDCHTITPNFRQVDVFNGYTAAAGSSFIYSDALPERFQGMAMVCEPTMKTVSLMKVVPDGSGYKALDGFNLFASSDEWTSPVCAEVGPDGAVWVADFQNFIIQHNPTPSSDRGGFTAKTGVGGAHENVLRDHERGRIYRVHARSAKCVPTAPTLTSGNVAARLLAQQQAIETGDAAGLSAIVKANDGSPAAIHALWALQGCGKLDVDSHRAALLAKDAKLRRNAIRALGNDAASSQLFFGAGVITDPDLTTRLAAMVKLADFPTAPEVQTLVKSLASDPVLKADEWLTEAVRMLGARHQAKPYREGPNLLSNAGFEEMGADKLPVGWLRRDYGGARHAEGNQGAQWSIVIDPKMVRTGKHGVRCITRVDADTSLYMDAPLKPNTEYRLSAWIKTHAFKGKASLNDHIGRAETVAVKRTQTWTYVETIFNSKDRPKASINLLHVAKGDTYFDDVALVELIPDVEAAAESLVGDVKRGDAIFWNHPVAACKNCHTLKGQGSAVGPALDGIAGRKDEAYITQSLLFPNAILAEGYVATPISPMPPMNLILKPQELADVKAFILSLK